MSFIPVFELGLWNAWILVIPILIILFSAMRATAARESGRAGDFKLTTKENRISNAFFIPLLISWLYSIFLPLQLDTLWLYIGLIVYLFGIALTIITILTFSTSPKDKLITKGVYQFSRNPMVMGMFLMQIGVGVACSSWVYLLLTSVLMIVFNTLSPIEERFCLYLYGAEYQKYKDRTPRWIGIPKSDED